jgi:hypothetical protein
MSELQTALEGLSDEGLRQLVPFALLARGGEREGKATQRAKRRRPNG